MKNARVNIPHKSLSFLNPTTNMLFDARYLMLRFHGYRYAKMPDEPKPVPAAPVPAKETISAPEKQKREKKRKKRRAEKRETSVTSSSSDSSESENDERTKKLAALQEQVRDYLINREFVTALTVSLLCLVAKESFRYLEN